MSDIHHGLMWSSLLDTEENPFVGDDDHSLMLTVNCDWFAPFDGTYSVGAIYVTINNLPRAERYKTENVLLVGIMPGPKEPSTFQINNYLQPMVDELLELYAGVNIRTFNHRGGTRVRAALLNVACDIPASRKFSSFTSHSSTRGRNKCTREFCFDTDTGSLNYTGADIPDGTLQTMQEKREAATNWRAAQTATAREGIEREIGTRWAQLH